MRQSATSDKKRAAPMVLDDLLRRRVIMMVGKGGVGRTSVGGAIAMLAARRGKRVLVMETEASTPIAASYGKKPGLTPLEYAPNLWGLFLGGQEALEDYLGLTVPRPILRVVFASSLYKYFVQAAPAVRELTMMGKIYHEIARRPKGEPRWDLIIVDMPASGQALSMLKMPFVAVETFAGSIVGREARDVARFFCDSDLCAMAVVSTAEALAVAETLEVERELKALELSTAAVIVNRIAPERFEASDVARLLRRGAQEPGLKHLDELAEIARLELRRVNRQQRILEILARQVEAPTILLEECSPGCAGGVVAGLAERLARYSSAEPGASRTDGFARARQ